MNENELSALGGASSGALTGAALGPEGALIGAGVGTVLGLLKPKRPKYTIRPEVDQNKALATESAFGLNPSIQRGINQVDQNAAQDVNTAQQYTSNTGSILNVLRSINSSRNASVQGLLEKNAELNLAGRNQLMDANKTAIDEYDKSFNYNVNQPYQNSVAANRDIIKGGAENFWRLMDSINAKKLLTPNGGTLAYGDVG